jgi:arsenate reductase-like glutaredoxin family protein
MLASRRTGGPASPRNGTDAQLIDQMPAHPILMQRPIVVTASGIKLCRPAETVLEILPRTGGVLRPDPKTQCDRGL